MKRTLLFIPKVVATIITVILGLIFGILATLIHFIIYLPYITFGRWLGRFGNGIHINLLSAIGVVIIAIKDGLLKISNYSYALTVQITSRNN